jgi:hypothetical protein
VEDTSKLLKFYALLRIADMNVNQIDDDHLKRIGMTKAEASELLNQDLPWPELEKALADREAFAEIAPELGVSEEYLLDLQARLRDPHGKPYSDT